MPEVLQSERKQAKEKHSVRRWFHTLLKVDSKEGVFSNFIHLQVTGVKTKIEEDFSVIEEYNPLHQILFNTLIQDEFSFIVGYRTWAKSDKANFVPVMMTFDFFKCPAVTAQVIIS